MRRAEREAMQAEWRAARGVTLPTYECRTCRDFVQGTGEARKHAKQGHKTQKAAFQAGELHSLHLVVPGPTVIVREFYKEGTP